MTTLARINFKVAKIIAGLPPTRTFHKYENVACSWIFLNDKFSEK